jgi:hypothetical protein
MYEEYTGSFGSICARCASNEENLMILCEFVYERGQGKLWERVRLPQECRNNPHQHERRKAAAMSKLQN